MLRDVHLAVKVTADPTWREVEKNIDLALVMLDSGVSQEAGYHLTRALSHVTDIGQRSMSELKGERAFVRPRLPQIIDTPLKL